MGYFVGPHEFWNPAFVADIASMFRGFFPPSKYTKSRDGSSQHLLFIWVEVLPEGVTSAWIPALPSSVAVKSPTVTQQRQWPLVLQKLRLSVPYLPSSRVAHMSKGIGADAIPMLMLSRGLVYPSRSMVLRHRRGPSQTPQH